MENCSSRVYQGHLRQALHCESKACPPTLEPGQQLFEVVQCECLTEYPEPPAISFNFTYVAASFLISGGYGSRTGYLCSVDGHTTQVVYRLPLVLAKFMQPFPMDKQTFASRWAMLNGCV